MQGEALFDKENIRMTTQLKAEAAKTIPAIPELPFIGSLMVYNKDPLKFNLRALHNFGDIAKFHFGPFPTIMINSPDLAHSVLVEHTYDFDKGLYMHKAFEPIIGKGLFINEGEFHRQQRKLLAPSFQPRHITSYADTMAVYSEQIQRRWQHGMTIDVGHEMTHLTMSIVGKVLFDADVFTETDELGAAMTTAMSFLNYSISHVFPIPMNWPVPRSNRARKAAAILDSRIQKMIETRKENHEERNDFLSILLNSRDEDGNGMSDKQIRDEALTLFGAGHETTATALTWAWYLLTQHPAVYDKVIQEVDSVLQGRTPTYADLVRLPYTLQVLKETIRLYPPAYAVGRTALHDMEIGGYPIPKGNSLVISIYAIHRRADVFPDPEKFDPERFTPENEKRLPRYAYMPFGAGLRICIGNHFALMEGHLVLATLAQRVRFELVAGQHPLPDVRTTITTRPDRSIRMVCFNPQRED
jgi:cytochrome P450